MPRTTTLFLAAYAIALQYVEVAYSIYEMSLPPAFDFLSPLAFLGLTCWWLERDSRETGVSWPLDIGMFMYSAWILILPYHLLKTRGRRRGLVDIGLFAGVVIAMWILGSLALLALIADVSVVE